MSNIAEGFERGGRPAFHQFFVIAKGYCAEVRSQFYMAKDVGYFTEKDLNTLMDLSIESSRMIGGLRTYIHK